MIAPAWSTLLRALTLLAVDPEGLKGVKVRVRAGPVRTALDTVLTRLPGAQRRIHSDLPDTQLFGGLDVVRSLTEGRMVEDAGIVARPATLVLPMAERTPPSLAARLSQVLDADRGHRLILLDEGAEPEEQVPASLSERLAFAVDLTGLRHCEVTGQLPAPGDLDAARAALKHVRIRHEDAAVLTALALRFGIVSLRAPHLALRTARALAALEGRDEINDEDLSEAAKLIFAPRATQLPETEDDQPPADAPPETQADADGEEQSQEIPEDLMVEAVRAAVPHDLLARLDPGTGGVRGATGSGAGTKRKGNRRGRPLPSRPGRPDGRARIDVVATLRAAAPWQALRREARPDASGVIVTTDDIRLKRYEDKSDRLILFIVDASGSAAMSRLGEAKGALELLLAQAYTTRDFVALVSFRGTGAEVLLPPTRSLVQAKRRLAALPGGGGTPLASGLREALGLAAQSRHHGLTPAFALLTDGKANLALDGSASRVQAAEDVAVIARHIAADGMPGLVIDISPRPGPETAALAKALAARHLALPRADAARISHAVTSALSG
ncbi:magnesium chelatase subunit D [Maritimibacter sp. UBA3975]|uniref:magnesium chelatase subunit D n=1 Tax=Maritimibacter sp. UBA3975 TaxID=1946833 RepID=UPI000C0A20C8|nr:magnesium chelatase subunit D [Maritimibacter sp. UBA3975]MAM62939.1 magnesium chelatase ATPase subunit D [Maritimibacter sp.]|tara:strand:- start:42234 stop:43901 length:1668 start_codon:yes stop_codon:yes gene_type:complete